MTSLQVTMMLHYAAIASPYARYEPEHANSRAVYEQRIKLCNLDLLREGGPAGWQVTDRGRAYVEHVKSVQVPICQWVQP